MLAPLNAFRNRYQETLLDFLWREWTALGVAGRQRTQLRHVIDPEALLLLTCSVGRYDPRLFDEVIDWLVKNGRFINVQRLRNMLRKENFRGDAVMAAMADWLGQRGAPTKWKLLAKPTNSEASALHDAETYHNYAIRETLTSRMGMKESRVASAREIPDTPIPYPRLPKIQTLFFLPDGRPVPVLKEADAVFRRHGFLRTPLAPRGFAAPFSPDDKPAQLLRLRALFGVNTRADVLNYLALNGTGHPREVARELYYSQKAIHDVLSDLECSGAVVSARSPRERTFRLTPDGMRLLNCGDDRANWINWPVLLSAAETVWSLVEESNEAPFEQISNDAKIWQTLETVYARLTPARWAAPFATPAGSDGLVLLEHFRKGVERITA